jgi:type I restriction enzyme S subunit
MTGAAIKRIILRNVKLATIPLPTVAEQHRIVAELDEGFAAIADAQAVTERNLRNATELFGSHVTEVFHQGGDQWVTRRLGDVCQIARGGSPRPIQAFLTTSQDGINWIKIGDATASGKYIYKTKEKILPAGASRSRIVREGDFLLSNSMSFGRPYIMRTTGCIHDGWLVLSDYESNLDQDYLYHLLGSQFVYEQFDRLAAGATVRNLNTDLAGRVEIPIPPRDQQRQIATEFEAVSAEAEELVSLKKQKLNNLEALQQSLLHQAFIGAL